MDQMKNLISKFIVLIFCVQSLYAGEVFASSRVEELYNEDIQDSLSKLAVQVNELKTLRTELTRIDRNLRLTKKGQNIYLKFENIAGTVLMVGIVIGSYKAYFPPGLRAMLSAYVTVTAISHGLIKLTDLEVKKLLAQLSLISNRLTVSEKNLKRQIDFYCRADSSSSLCHQ